MNERIQELFEKAANKDFPTGVSSIHPNELERFAELIVRECSAKAWFAEQYDMGDGAPISKQIKETFRS